MVGLSRNGRYVQLAASGSQLAPTTVAYDWQTKKLETWRLPATPEVDVKTPCPVIVSFHGGPEGQATAGLSP